MIGNVSRGTGWLRVVLSLGCFGVLAWAVYVLVANNGTAYWNLGGGDHVYYYAILVGYLVTFLAGLVGIISGVAGVRSPGDAPGLLFNVVLFLLTVGVWWSGVMILNARVFLD